MREDSKGQTPHWVECTGDFAPSTSTWKTKKSKSKFRRMKWKIRETNEECTMRVEERSNTCAQTRENVTCKGDLFTTLGLLGFLGLIVSNRIKTQLNSFTIKHSCLVSASQVRKTRYVCKMLAFARPKPRQSRRNLACLFFPRKCAT